MDGERRSIECFTLAVCLAIRLHSHPELLDKFSRQVQIHPERVMRWLSEEVWLTSDEIYRIKNCKALA